MRIFLRQIHIKNLRLEVNTDPSTTLNPNSVATPYDGTTAMLPMTTMDATNADLGDHVELRLKETTGNTPFSNFAYVGTFSAIIGHLFNFSLTLYKCWASKDPLPTVTGEDTQPNPPQAMVSQSVMNCTYMYIHVIYIYLSS